MEIKKKPSIVVLGSRAVSLNFEQNFSGCNPLTDTRTVLRSPTERRKKILDVLYLWSKMLVSCFDFESCLSHLSKVFD